VSARIPRRIGRDRVTVSDIEGTLYNGSFKGDGTVKWGSQIDGDGRFNLKGVEVGQLLPAFRSAFTASGALDFLEGTDHLTLTLKLDAVRYVPGGFDDDSVIESVDVVEQASLDEVSLSVEERAHASLGLGMLDFGQGDKVVLGGLIGLSLVQADLPLPVVFGHE